MSEQRSGPVPSGGQGPIRAAEPADVGAILAMVRELAAYERSADEVEMTADDLTAALFGPAPVASSLVADDPRAGPVGFALWFVTFSTWTGQPGIYLEDLYVAPEHRRAGYGRALLAGLARICSARGYPRLEWAVLDWNTPAHDFYRTLGAAPTDEWTRWRMTAPALTALASDLR